MRYFMRYFLMIGLMMAGAGSVAQADICIPLWWGSATDFQVELEAELKGPFAMNDRCPDGRLPVELALENATYPPVFDAILENFELDGRSAYHAKVVAGRQLQQAYRELSARAESVFGPVVVSSVSSEPEISAREFIEWLRNTSPDVQRNVILSLGFAEYVEVRPTARVGSYDDYSISEEKMMNINNYIDIDDKIAQTNAQYNYDTQPRRTSFERGVEDIENREAYDQALEEYHIQLAIYNIVVVPSE